MRARVLLLVAVLASAGCAASAPRCDCHTDWTVHADGPRLRDALQALLDAGNPHVRLRPAQGVPLADPRLEARWGAHALQQATWASSDPRAGRASFQAALLAADPGNATLTADWDVRLGQDEVRQRLDGVLADLTSLNGSARGAWMDDALSRARESDWDFSQLRTQPKAPATRESAAANLSGPFRLDALLRDLAPGDLPEPEPLNGGSAQATYTIGPWVLTFSFSTLAFSVEEGPASLFLFAGSHGATGGWLHVAQPETETAARRAMDAFLGEGGLGGQPTFGWDLRPLA